MDKGKKSITPRFKVKLKKQLKKKAATCRRFKLCNDNTKFRPEVKLPDSWNAMRKTKQLTDCVIYSNDNKPLAVHKVVLRILGPYFKRLFKSPGNDGSVQNKIKLPIESNILECLIDYAYTGHCSITVDNVNELLSKAKIYGVSGIVKKCCEFLCNNMKPNSCVRYFNIVKPYLCPEWRCKMLRYICHHFMNIIENDTGFVELKKDDLKEVLQSDELNVRNEEVVFEAILKWIRFQSRSRRKHLETLIECPRFGFMTYKYYTEKVMLHRHIMNNDKIQEKLFDASVFLTKIISKNITTIDIDDPVARPRIPYDILFVIGGWSTGKPTNMIETYDARANQWYVSDNMDELPVAYHGTAVVNNIIYVIGGFNGRNFLNNVRCYNPVTHEWGERAGMYQKRCYVSTCVLDGKIYALGGFNGRMRMQHAEMYDPERNQWVTIPDMNTRRSDASAASMNEKVYIAGGYNGHQILKSVECFDPKTQQWTFLLPMNKIRAGLNLIAWNNRLYVIGGTNGLVRAKSGECYDGQNWNYVSNMENRRSNACSAVVDDLFFIIGGYDGRKTLDCVECYDPVRNCFTVMNSLNASRSASSACIVSGLPNAKEYSYLRNESLQFKDFETKIEKNNENTDKAEN